MNKCHYMSRITGELHENIWEVIVSIKWWLTHYHALNITLSDYIKYIFLWDYSRQGW